MVAISVVVVGFVVFGFWREMRRRGEAEARAVEAERRALEARREASVEVSKMKNSLHDVSKTLNSVLLEAEVTPGYSPLVTRLVRAQIMLRDAQGLPAPKSELRLNAEPDARPDAETESEAELNAAQIFALIADEQRTSGVDIEIERDSDTGPAYSGLSLWVQRIALNVLVNAVREAAECDDSNVHVRLTDDSIVVVNPTNDARRARDSIRGRYSAHNSSGRGLGIVYDHAEMVGWSVSFEIDESRAEVTTRIQPRLPRELPRDRAPH